MMTKFAAVVPAMIMALGLFAGCGESVEVNRAEEALQSEAESGQVDEMSVREGETETDEAGESTVETEGSEASEPVSPLLLARVISNEPGETPIIEVEYEYDSAGNPTREAHYHEGKVYECWEWEYDESGNLLMELSDSLDGSYYRDEYRYNEAGNRQSRIAYNADGNIDCQYEWEY